MHAPPNQYVQQLGTKRRQLAMWLTVGMVSGATMALIIGAPLALSTGHSALGFTIYQTFSHVCHQIPERSFFIDGHPFAVCSRCTGLYAGFMMTAVVYPLVRSLRQTETPARKWLFMASAPLATDFALEFFGLWHNTHFSRFATGALLGSVAVLYVMPGLIDLSLREWRGKRNHATSSPATIDVTRAEVLSSSDAPSDYSAPHRRI